MVQLSKLLSEDRVAILKATDKDAVLGELAELLAGSPSVHDGRALLEAIRAREKIMSTGIGFGIAVPHVKIPGVDDITMAVGVSPRGISYGSLDDKPVHIVVMIAANEGQQDQYVRTLARVMLVLKNPKNRERLVAAGSAADIYRILAAY
ncbi:MAG: PTS sugar transporter subunit IIA [Planctomycetes bacterium]|nr:PTS sugar transporter subunit IIA [Planctomycetota bacterium]